MEIKVLNENHMAGYDKLVLIGDDGNQVLSIDIHPNCSEYRSREEVIISAMQDLYDKICYWINYGDKLRPYKDLVKQKVKESKKDYLRKCIEETQRTLEEIKGEYEKL